MKLKNILRSNHSSRGQIAVFIALIFQVLFVFFAMVINIGLLVHDKINLQNSVDIAAVYGAQRQAESLNAIAHSNYQIRQSWKLLAWRLRVIGDMGRTGHPSNFAGSQIDFKEERWNDDSTKHNGGLAVCVAHKAWSYQFAQDQNPCATFSDKNFDPDILKIQKLNLGIGAALPWNIPFLNENDKLIAGFMNDCDTGSVENWRITLKWLATYRADIASRQLLIHKIANQMAEGTDISGANIEAGVNMSLMNNLTKSNRESIAEFKVLNSMNGLSQEQWLRRIKIFPSVRYMDMFGNTGSCKAVAKFVFDYPKKVDPSKVPYIVAAAEPKDAPLHSSQDMHHSSMGVEKNPWYMTYYGVKAQSAPRKPFYPFGSPVVLTARAFAQPFGGRIGPWYRKTWPRESIKSSGPMTDALLPAEVDFESTGDQNLLLNRIPNYSRYPGDTLGLFSKRALSLFGKHRIANMQNSKLPLIDPNFYETMPTSIFNNAEGVVASNKNKLNWLSEFEIGAIAPDLFDVQYYSIQPTFYDSFIVKASNQFGEGLPMRADIGALEDSKMSVQYQMQIRDKTILTKEAYMLSSWQHLLTGWSAPRAFDFSFPTNRFGKCLNPALEAVPSEGACSMGGRAGYSVKIVSKEYLNSEELAMGGKDIKGPLLNAPGDF